VGKGEGRAKRGGRIWEREGGRKEGRGGRREVLSTWTKVDFPLPLLLLPSLLLPSASSQNTFPFPKTSPEVPSLPPFLPLLPPLPSPRLADMFRIVFDVL